MNKRIDSNDFKVYFNKSDFQDINSEGYFVLQRNLKDSNGKWLPFELFLDLNQENTFIAIPLNKLKILEKKFDK